MKLETTPLKFLHRDSAGASLLSFREEIQVRRNQSPPELPVSRLLENPGPPAAT